MARIDKLKAGYKKFYQKYFTTSDSIYKKLALGQAPKTLVISCSDSRVDPAIITNADPGDVFVVRNVANLVPPALASNATYHGVSAALEFGVKGIKVEHIVVIGHSGCAGIQTLYESDDKIKKFDYVDDWVRIAQKAKEKAQKAEKNQLSCCEQEAILISLENLLTYSWIKEKVDSGSLKLWGWYFSVEDGSLLQWQAKSKKFVQLSV